MPETTANTFRKTLKFQIDAIIANHEVLKVRRRNGENFVVIGENGWKAIEETLYLNPIFGFPLPFIQRNKNTSSGCILLSELTQTF